MQFKGLDTIHESLSYRQLLTTWSEAAHLASINVSCTLFVSTSAMQHTHQWFLNNYITMSQHVP